MVTYTFLRFLNLKIVLSPWLSNPVEGSSSMPLTRPSNPGRASMGVYIKN
jgi:hypothetical protein